MNLDVTRGSDLTYALSSPIVGTGVPLSMKRLGTSGDGAKKKTEFVVHVPADGVSIRSQQRTEPPQLRLCGGRLLEQRQNCKSGSHDRQDRHPSVPDAQMASLRTNGIDMKNVLELAPGQHVVRVVIRDNVTGKIGSVTAPLSVN